MTPPSQASKKMVTLKNPLYDTISKREPSRIDKNSDICEPAAIFKNENGTVTIRSSKLHESLSNGAALNPMPMAMPGLISKPTTNPTPYIPPPVGESTEMTPFNAQAILSGLPGIEITKVIKKVPTTETEVSKSCQTAQVSIMPSPNCGEKFNFEKDDWMYGE
nr:uncharacterized protein LOC111517343 isoform X2 [Leptinotarsa decemlineata]